MPLTWNIEKCADSESLKTDEEWDTTYVLIMSCPTIGIGNWTEAEAPEIYARLKLVEKVCGSVIWKLNKETNHSEDYYVTPEDVRKRIGLSTNVVKETRAQFIKRVMDVEFSYSQYEFKKAMNSGYE